MRTVSLIAGLIVLAGLICLPLLPSAVADEQPAGWGTVKGQIIFDGDKVPDRAAQNVDKDQAHCLSKGPILSEEWVVNPKNKGVKWAIVWLAATNNLKSPGTMPIHPSLAKSKVAEVVMDQPCCAFEPHVLALRDDQTLVFKNSAPVAHNVNYNGCGAMRNVLLAPKSEEKATGLQYNWAGMTVGCNIHGWMKARVFVFDHPYFAVTDEDGNFEIKDAPAGDYYLIVWHDTFKDSKTIMVNGKPVITAGQKISIKADKENELKPIGLKDESK
jgi:hypothetical protein